MSRQYDRKPSVEQRMRLRRRIRVMKKRMTRTEEIQRENAARREADADRVIVLMEQFIENKIREQQNPDSQWHTDLLSSARKALKAELLS